MAVAEFDAPDTVEESATEATDRPDTVAESARFPTDAPDSLWCGVVLEADCPDSSVQSVVMVFDRPDRIVTAPLVVADCPDTVSQVCLLVADCPDQIVSGSLPNNVASTLFPSGGGQRMAAPTAWATLKLNGALVPYEHLTLNRKVKGGWNWSATLPHNSLDPYTVHEWRITICDGLGYLLTSPPLIALPRELTDSRSETAPSATVSGVDKTTWRLGVANKSFDTFRNTNSGAVLQVLASSEGLTISGAENYPVIDEDSKQIKLASAIGRVTYTSAQEWEVDETGAIRLFRWSELAGALEVDYSTIKHKVELQKRFTSLKIGKRSAHHGGGTVQGSQDYPFTDVGPKVTQLTTPLYNPQASNRSTLGFVDLVAFYDGDPTRPSSTMIALNVWNQGLGLNFPPPTPNGKPATHFSCYCFNPGGTVQIVTPGLTPDKVVCLLRVTGTPPAVKVQMQGTEPEFLYPYDSGITPAWPAPDWVDNLPPTKAWAVAHAPDYLSILSKGWDGLHIDAVCHANVKPRQWFPYNGIIYKVDDVSWDCPGGAPTTSIELVRV